MATRKKNRITVYLSDDGIGVVEFTIDTEIVTQDGNITETFKRQYLGRYDDQTSAVKARLDQLATDADTWLAANEPL